MVPATAGPLDVVIGKPTHHACAMPAADGKISDKFLSHDKVQSRKVFVDLQDHRTVLVAVDQPAPIGALSLSGAWRGRFSTRIAIVFIPLISTGDYACASVLPSR
ncbi:insertion element membrane protein [Corynebacterium maris DSM 45190]|uniref:Insertion element membrane protein n=1 Tax=Corynebacterium maris DSM 45190 TaxID=1224163 RepID=S5TFC2_9CORY|nr:insertion element membrane protein [Corynebacterium maris DSM 45190]